jgi:hypothetical protein
MTSRRRITTTGWLRVVTDLSLRKKPAVGRAFSLRRGTSGSCRFVSNKPAKRRPVITRRVRSGQSSRWRSDPMRPLSTYSLLWWSPGRVYLGRDLPNDRSWRCRCLVGLFRSFSIFVCPVVRGSFLTIPAAAIHPRRRHVVFDPYNTLKRTTMTRTPSCGH